MSDDNLVEIPRARFAPWLLEPMRTNTGDYAKVALAAVFINIFGLLTAIFTMVVYDRVVPNNAFASLLALTIGLIIVVLFDFVLKLLRAYFVDFAGAQIDRDVGETVFGRLLAMRLELRKGSTGSLIGLMRELEALREFFASATLTALVDVPFALITLAAIALIGGKIVLVPALIMPIVILVGWLTRPALDRLSAKALSEGMQKQSVLVETVGSIEIVKAVGAGPLLARRWRDALIRQSHSAMRQRLIGTAAVTFATSASTISYAGVVIYGVFLIADHALTSGGLIACSILSGRAIAPLTQIAQLLSRLSATRTAYRQVSAMMELRTEGPGEGLVPKQMEGRIEFRNVSFRYPGGSERAIDGISFSIAGGEHVALVGRVGSGKSTVARLILGLYPPEDGLVMIDGSDLRQMNPIALRSFIGAAMQESTLLTGSVRENILLGRSDVDDVEMVRVAEISGTHHFIGQLANGYDLKLADRGEGLSGGQRQSIAIARALVGKPPIIVMDEPSSAMDGQTETALLQRLAEELQGRTLILVTHRPSLLALVNRVIVIEQGKVAADGPRDAVLQQISRPRAA